MRIQKALCITREPRAGQLPLGELNELLADGWLVASATADGQSSILVIVEKGKDDEPPPAPAA
jgi:hypothetical protein